MESWTFRTNATGFIVWLLGLFARDIVLISYKSDL